VLRPHPQRPQPLYTQQQPQQQRHQQQSGGGDDPHGVMAWLLKIRRILDVTPEPDSALSI